MINVFFGGQSPMTENLAPFNFSTLQLSTVLGAKFDSLAENPDEPLCPQVQQALSAGVHAFVYYFILFLFCFV